MAKKTQDLLDLETICKRVKWSLKQTPETMMEHIRANRMDALHTIPHPTTGGMLIIGKEGTDGFWAIARRHLTAHAERKRRTNLTSFVEQLRVEFSQLFLAEGANADQLNVDLWIDRAYAATAREHETTTHYIPCGLIHTDNVKSFAVGPVTFVHETEFFRLYGAEIDKLPGTIRDRHRQRVEEAIEKGFATKNAATPEQSALWGEHLAAGLLESFKRYHWFAVVVVSAAHKEVSYDRALFATRGALNIIKILIGSYHTNRLRTADDYGSAGKAATLMRNSKGELGISLSTTPMDNMAGDQWYEFLTQSHQFSLLAHVLSLCCTFDDPPPLCSRLMDAFAWFGDAVGEKAPAAKIVKFVTAIERICGTGIERTPEGKKRGVTDIVLTRSSIIYSLITESTYKAARKEIERIYKCRSKLVHGSLSPFADEVAEQVYKTDRLTNILLLGAVDYFNTLGLEDRKLDEDGLREAFLKLEKWQEEGRPPQNMDLKDGSGSSPDHSTST